MSKLLCITVEEQTDSSFSISNIEDTAENIAKSKNITFEEAKRNLNTFILSISDTIKYLAPVDGKTCKSKPYFTVVVFPTYNVKINIKYIPISK